MPRQPRLELPGYPHHVVQRGVNRATVYFDADCRLAYLSLLRHYAGIYRVSVHAWCLMTNHVHLLVTPEREGGLGKLMQNLNRDYAQRVNHRFERTGALWAGRYRSNIVDTDRYLFACMSYIEFNPVRAGMVAQPGDWLWSSWHANAGERSSVLVVPRKEYLALGDRPSSRRQRYRAIVAQQLPESVLEALRRAATQNRAVGSDEFLQRIGRLAGREVTPRLKGRPQRR